MVWYMKKTITSNKNFFYVICESLYKITNFIKLIILKMCYYFYKTMKYLVYGLIFPIVFIAKKISKSINKKKEQKLEQLEQIRQTAIENTPVIDEKEEVVEKEEYVNEEINVEEIKKKRSFIDLLNDTLDKIVAYFSKTFKDVAFIKQFNNEKMIKSNEALVKFDQENEVTLEKKVAWRYTAFDLDGKKVKGTVDAHSRVEVHSYLLSEGLTPYSIETSRMIQLLYGNLNTKKKKIKTKDLIFLLTQLSTYLKSGITLVESLNILIRQTKNKNIKYILREATQELTMGESFSKALEKQGNAFPKLLINMVKASELTGELPETLDDMIQYYTDVEATRKQMISALTYPSIVFVFTVGVITFVLLYVVPQFVNIYNSMDASEIPAFTKAVIGVSDFLKANFLVILIVILIIVAIIIFLYKNIRIIRTLMQWIIMHIPILGNIIIYNEVTMFAKTFSSLLSHNVFITDSMEILNRVTNNEIYKMMILDTVSNLAKGDKISKAFRNQWAFPIPAYEMIVTGEKTGQLVEMMAMVANYYQELHKNTVSRIKALVEPILIVFLTFAVGVILLAIIIPMFNMYQQVQSLG